MQRYGIFLFLIFCLVAGGEEIERPLAEETQVEAESPWRPAFSALNPCLQDVVREQKPTDAPAGYPLAVPTFAPGRRRAAPADFAPPIENPDPSF